MLVFEKQMCEFMNVRDWIMNIFDGCKCDSFRYYLNSNVYPTNLWYRDNLERNFEMVNLGNELSQHSFRVQKGEKRMNWGLKEQTLKQDFAVLKNFFSILKDGGIAVFPFYSCGELFNGWKDVKDIRPYLFDMQAYSFTNSHLRIVAMKIAKHIPLLLIRPKDIYPLFKAKALKRSIDSGICKSLDKCHRMRFEKSDIDKVKHLIEEIHEFCEVRNIKPVFVKMPQLTPMDDEVDYSNVFADSLFLDCSINKCWLDVSLYEPGGVILNDKGRCLLVSIIKETAQ